MKDKTAKAENIHLEYAYEHLRMARQSLTRACLFASKNRRLDTGHPIAKLFNVVDKAEDDACDCKNEFLRFSQGD